MGCGPREMSHGFEQSNAAIEDGMPCSCLFQREYYTIYAQSPQEKNGLQPTGYEPYLTNFEMLEIKVHILKYSFQKGVAL